NEVALGSKTLTALHKKLGDTVQVEGRTATMAFRIVGRVALPPLGQGQPIADGAVFTGAGFAPLFDRNSFQRYFVARFAPHADVPSVRRRLDATPQLGPPTKAIRPVELQRLHQVGWLPTTVAVLFGALGLLALAHSLVTTVRV